MLRHLGDDGLVAILDFDPAGLSWLVMELSWDPACSDLVPPSPDRPG